MEHRMRSRCPPRIRLRPWRPGPNWWTSGSTTSSSVPGVKTNKCLWRAFNWPLTQSRAYTRPITAQLSPIFAGVADRALRRPGGRTARVREAALRATLQELLENGYADSSLEAIARRSGVSRATLYRRWGGRSGLLLDAVEWFGVTQAEVPDT